MGPDPTLGNVYLESRQNHKLRVAIMSDDPKCEYENNIVEKKRKSDQERWLSKNYYLNVKKQKKKERKRVEQKEVRVTSTKIKGESKEKRT